MEGATPPTAVVHRPLLRNFSALVASRGVTLLSGLVITAWLGRKLGPVNFGVIGFATAVLSYFALVVAAGLEVIGARDIARNGGRVRAVSSAIFTLRLLLAVLAGTGLVLFILLLSQPVVVKLAIAVHGAWLLAIAINMDFVYQGRARMGLIALREVLVSLLTLAGVLILIRRPDQVLLAAAIMMAAMVLGAGLVFTRCRVDYRAPMLRVSPYLWKRLSTAALPIAAAGALVTMYRNLDMVMIGFMRPPAELGFYTAAFKFFTTSLAPAAILMTAFTPALAAAYGDRSAVAGVMRVFSAAMALFATPVTVIGFVFAPELLGFLFGNSYAASITTLRLLMIAACLASFGICYGHPLMLWRMQGQILSPLVTASAVNGGLNLALIPRFGIEGAAAASVATEVVLLVWFAMIQRRAGGVLGASVAAAHLAAAAAAAALAAFAVPLLPAGLFVAGSAAAPLTGPALAAAIYGGLVAPYWLCRLVRTEEAGKRG